ncbi:uncharacterized protein LOC124140069 [Haliotis rufescens]|uniref:uncharacterized protein LOC124140069 n=1 Tax=Haliotis rufescens TaxID=6454 RepID=UPI00201E96F6|nr:uncharacterized protein LOC124140069 [Haliotis rufescens]
MVRLLFCIACFLLVSPYRVRGQACPSGDNVVHVCQPETKEGTSIQVDGSKAKGFHGQCVCEVHAVGGAVVVRMSAPVVPAAQCGALVFSTEIGFTAQCGNPVPTVSGSIETKQNAFLTIATEKEDTNSAYCVKVEKESGDGQVRVICTEITDVDRANKATTTTSAATTSKSGGDIASGQACPSGDNVVHVCQPESKEGTSIQVDGSKAKGFHGQCVCEVHAVGGAVVVRMSAPVVPAAQCGAVVYSTYIGFTAQCGNPVPTVSGSIGTEQNAFLTIATEKEDTNSTYCVKVEKESGDGQVRVTCTEITHGDRPNKATTTALAARRSSGGDITSSSGGDTTSNSTIFAKDNFLALDTIYLQLPFILMLGKFI